MVGDYTVDMYDYIFKMSLIAGEKDNELFLRGLFFYDFRDLKATLDEERGMLNIELGQVVAEDYNLGDVILATYTYNEENKTYEERTSGILTATVNEDGSIMFDPNDRYIYMSVKEGEHAGEMVDLYLTPYIILTPGFPKFSFVPWEDRELTYLSTDGDYLGNVSELLTGLAFNYPSYANLEITSTNLVNVEDPDDQLLLSVGNNLNIYTPIMVGENEIQPFEDAIYGNKPISTLAGEWEYIYIDYPGTEEDFAGVKDVLEGIIAICDRGSISFSEKANAAMKNGAAGIIIANNQSGYVYMNLSNYEYDKPAVTVSANDGNILRKNGTYVEGDTPYYHGTLTITDTKKYERYAKNWDYGNTCYIDDVNTSAVVPDWTQATPGATYKATINYKLYYEEYDEDNQEVKDGVMVETTPTTLTLVVPNETGINDVTIKRNSDNRMYNLMGMPVRKDYKGIVIHNGKKILR